MRYVVCFVMIGLAAGCSTTNFPVGQAPPPGMNAAIQQEVVAQAVEAAVGELSIEPKASWEDTANVYVESPFSVYSGAGGQSDHGVVGYLRTLVEVELTKQGFHVVSGNVEPDWEITIDIRTAGADVKETDYVVYQKNTLKAVASFRVYIRKAKADETSCYIAQGQAVSDPYIWRHTILYFISFPDVKYRALGEPTLWDRFFSLRRDVSSGMNQASTFQQQMNYAR